MGLREKGPPCVAYAASVSQPCLPSWQVHFTLLLIHLTQAAIIEATISCSVASASERSAQRKPGMRLSWHSTKCKHTIILCHSSAIWGLYSLKCFHSLPWAQNSCAAHAEADCEPITRCCCTVMPALFESNSTLTQMLRAAIRDDANRVMGPQTRFETCCCVRSCSAFTVGSFLATGSKSSNTAGAIATAL